MDELALSEEIARKLKPHEEQKSADIAQEVVQLVSLVPDSRRQITGSIPFDVVVLDVMVVVRVPRMSHERVGDVGKERVKQPELLGEDSAHVDVLVHHERVGPHVVRLHDPVEDPMDPSEVIVQVDCTGDGGGEVQDEMRQHHNVGFHPDNLSA